MIDREARNPARLSGLASSFEGHYLVADAHCVTSQCHPSLLRRETPRSVLDVTPELMRRDLPANGIAPDQYLTSPFRRLPFARSVDDDSAPIP